MKTRISSASVRKSGSLMLFSRGCIEPARDKVFLGYINPIPGLTQDNPMMCLRALSKHSLTLCSVTSLGSISSAPPSSGREPFPDSSPSTPMHQTNTTQALQSSHTNFQALNALEQTHHWCREPRELWSAAPPGAAPRRGRRAALQCTAQRLSSAHLEPKTGIWVNPSLIQEHSQGRKTDH